MLQAVLSQLYKWVENEIFPGMNFVCRRKYFRCMVKKCARRGKDIETERERQTDKWIDIYRQT